MFIGMQIQYIFNKKKKKGGAPIPTKFTPQCDKLIIHPYW